MSILAPQKDDHVDGQDGEGHRAPSDVQEPRRIEWFMVSSRNKGKPCLTFTP